MNKNKLLKRKNIQKELLHFLDYPLTLLVAPMGYGKTTVALEFLKANNIDYIWFFLEIDETSPKYIWDTFARQLNSTNAEIGQLFKNIGFPSTTPHRNHVFSLIESFAKKKPLYIIIDDYQFNHSKEIDEFIRLLIRANIQNLKILILSRTIPRLNVTELKLKNKCYCIPEKYFSLSLSEVGKLYRLNKVCATNEAIEKTYKISEGWISAVLLLIQHYREIGSIDSNPHIEELIETTIMTKYDDVKDSIAVLGILESFSFEQLAFILGEEIARSLIEKLLRTGAFIRYDQKEKRYAIHNIFKKYLFEYRFKRLPISLQRRYYLKSGSWFVENRYVMEGIRCFLEVKEYEPILQEFEKNTIIQVFDYYQEIVIDIMEQIPEHLKCQYPLAYLCYLHFLITAYNMPYGKKLLIKMEENFKKGYISSADETLKIDGEIEFLKSFMVYNDAEKVFGKLKQAFEIIGGKSQTTRPDKMPCAGSNSLLYMAHKKEGTLKKITEVIYDNVIYYERLSNRIGTGIEYVVMSEYLLEIGKLKEAEIYAKKAVFKAEKLPQYDALICGTFILARCALAKGNIKHALGLMNGLTKNKNFEITALFYSIRSPYFFAMDAMHIKTGHYEDLTESLKNKELEEHMIFFHSRAIRYILYGQVLLYERKYIELEVLCDKRHQLFGHFNNLFGYLHFYLLEAIANFNLYGIEKAVTILEKALTIGRADGIVTSIAEYGEGLLPLLEASISKDIEDDYLAMLLLKTRAYADYVNCYRKSMEEVKLTPRENEIMQILRTGKSNAEIASELFVSESAVKKMLSSIYRKLGVKNRTAANRVYEEKY